MSPLAQSGFDFRWLERPVLGFVLIASVVLIALATSTPRGLSQLVGGEGERWTLTRARDALSTGIWRALAPGMVWICGAFFPGLQLKVTVLERLLAIGQDASTALRSDEADHTLSVLVDAGSLPLSFATPLPFVPTVTAQSWPMALGVLAGLGLLVLGAALLVFRLNAGLAYVSAAHIWKRARGEGRTASVVAVWRAGRGLVHSVLGIWMALLTLFLVAGLLLAGPLVLGLELFSDRELLRVLFGSLLVPVGAVLLMYLVLLGVLSQLALQSLARNRRGMASALIHAWRLVTSDPWASVRATLADLTLSLSLAIFTLGSISLLQTGGLSQAGLAAAILLLVSGIGGVARASYWAEAYVGLGGLGPEDGVPGLEQARSTALSSS